MPDQDRREVVVIGAGIAGLNAALHLAERGLHPLVLEADPLFVGGRVKGRETEEVDGRKFRMEHGVHGIWSPYRNLQAVLTRRRIRPVFVPAQEECWIYRRGDILNRANVGSAIRRSPIPAPFHYLNLFFRLDFLSALGIADWISLVGVWSGLLYAVGIDPLADNQPLEGVRLNDILKGWTPALKAFFIGLTRSGLAGRPEDIPLSGYIAFMRFYTVLRRDSWQFSYMPADGGTSLADPLACEVRNLGGEIHLGEEVTALTIHPEGWQITTRSITVPGSSESNHPISRTMIASQVILAMDPPSARKLIETFVDPVRVAHDFYWPLASENAIIRIWYNRSPEPCAEAGIFSGNFILDNYFWLDRIQDPYIQWRRETGGSAIEAHIYGPPELLAEPDALLISRAINDIQSAFPELRGSRIHQTIQRNPATHTLFGLGKSSSHLGIETPWHNLYCCGDWVRHPAPCLFLERATLTGIEAANAVLRSRDLPVWPLMDYLPPEPFVGWIEKMMVAGRKIRRSKKNGGKTNV
jgi:carotenoid phi-ring synthase / carotenoid chi-ring synthase